MITIEDILNLNDNDIRESIGVNQGKQFIHPSGRAEPIKGIAKEALRKSLDYYYTQLSRKKKHLAKEIQEHREKYGIKRNETLLSMIKDIHPQAVQKMGRLVYYIGQGTDLERRILSGETIINETEKRIITEAASVYSYFTRGIQKIFFMPKFFYEEEMFDFSKISQLTDQEKYANSGEVKSKFVKIKSKDGNNKISISYTLLEDGIIFQYLAFNLSGDSSQDKMHIVGKTDYFGNIKDIYHIEVQEKIHDYDINELAYLIKVLNEGINESDLMAILQPQKRIEYKTDIKTKEVFANITTHEDNVKRVGNLKFNKNITNFELIKNEPWIAGGPVFQKVIDYIKENENKLKEIYQRKIKG